MKDDLVREFMTCVEKSSIDCASLRIDGRDPPVLSSFVEVSFLEPV